MEVFERGFMVGIDWIIVDSSIGQEVGFLWGGKRR